MTQGDSCQALPPKSFFDAGAFDAFKFKPKKCKIIGADECDHTTFYMGDEEIKRVDTGILLGAVINKGGAIEKYCKKCCTEIINLLMTERFLSCCSVWKGAFESVIWHR